MHVITPFYFLFYHIKNLQSTKTDERVVAEGTGFITLRIYKVLKRGYAQLNLANSFITLRIYKVLKRIQEFSRWIHVLSH